MASRVLIAGGHSALRALSATNGEVEIVGHVGSVSDAEQALRALRPSVLVLDSDLAHREGLCCLPALRRASPGTAIVLPPAGEPVPASCGQSAWPPRTSSGVAMMTA